jgi:hypothetical protein
VNLVLFTYASSVVATGLAWALAWRRAEHRPVALLLTLGLATDLLRRALYLHVLVPGYQAAGGAALTGWYRVAGNLDAATFLVWPAAIAGASVRVYLGRRPVMVVVAWAVVGAALAACYPVARGALLARVFLVAELAALLVATGSIVTWARRRRVPDVQHVSVALVVAAELCAVVAGPWKVDLFGAWPLAQLGYAALYVVLIVLQGGSGCSRSSTWSSS